MTATFQFFGDLPFLLRRRWNRARTIVSPGGRRASIKDVIEAFGIPHTEVGKIERNEGEVDFGHIVEDGSRYAVHPVPVPWDVTRPALLRPSPLPNVSFVVDINVGRLARYLRAAGFDVLYNPGWHDRDIARLMMWERRILLTRDKGLLMRKQVIFGRYVRAEKPVDQLEEIVELLGLRDRVAPFTRCLECNLPLVPVAKEEVDHLLEPLTRKYYTTFSRCDGCGRIYWPGSHTEKMRRLLAGQITSSARQH